MKKFFTIIFFLSFLVNGYCQIPCRFDDYQKELTRKYEKEILKYEEEFKKFSKSQKGQSLKGNYNTITIPVVFHIVHGLDEFGHTKSNISDEVIMEQLAILNNDFSKLVPFKPGFGAPTRPMFNFCLAQTDPFGRPTSGITRTFGQNYYTYNALTGATVDDIFIKSKRWNPDIYLNIYITDLREEGNEYDAEPQSEDILFRIGGYSSAPEGARVNNTYLDKPKALEGVVMNYRYIGLQPNYVGPSRVQVLTHEVGHWLGLFHVFNKLECQFALQNGPFPECELYGDNICDTPVMTSYSLDLFDEDFNVVVEQVGPNLVKSCEGNTISSENFMDYGYETSFFTELQVERMHQKMAFYRPDIYNMTRLNADCTLDHGISLGGSGGSTPQNCNNDPGKTVYNSFTSFNPDYYNPFDQDKFGEAVALNKDWFVGTDPFNGWLQIFKRVDCDFESFQNFHIGRSFGKDVILNDNEIIVLSDLEITIYKYNGSEWVLRQKLPQSSFRTGLFLKENYLFGLGDNGIIYVHKKNSTGTYDYLQTIQNQFLPTYGYQVASLRNINSNGDKLILNGKSKRIMTMERGVDGIWFVDDVTEHPEFPENYGDGSITSSEKEIFVKFSENNQTIFTKDIEAHLSSGISSFEASPFPMHPNGVVSIRVKEMMSLGDNRLAVSHVRGTARNVVMNIYHRENDGTWQLLPPNRNNEPNRAGIPICTMQTDSYANSRIYSIFQDEIVLGGKGKARVYKFSDVYYGATFLAEKQFCQVPSQDNIYYGKIILGDGQCDLNFRNVSKTFKAKSSVTLLPGTHIESSSSVSINIVDSNCSTFVESSDPSGKSISFLKDDTENYKEQRAMESVKGIIISPNPTTRKIKIESSQDNTIISSQVFDLGNAYLFGYFNEKGKSQFELDFSTYPAGMYIIKFMMQDGSTISKKIIKE